MNDNLRQVDPLIKQVLEQLFIARILINCPTTRSRHLYLVKCILNNFTVIILQLDFICLLFNFI